MLNVVVFNGGRGAASIIPEFLNTEGVNVTSIVNAYDDGKSTGDIRRLFGMLGPSDIRKVQQLMLPTRESTGADYRRLYDFRYPEHTDRSEVLEDMEKFVSSAETIAGIEVSDQKVRSILRRYVKEFMEFLTLSEAIRNEKLIFSDCSLMNCIFAGAHLEANRDFEQATRSLDRLFRLRGTVLPNSNDVRHLAAIRQNGEVLYSEAEIVELRSNVLIDRIFLLVTPLPSGALDCLSDTDKLKALEKLHAPTKISDGVRRSIAQADIIVYAAGTQHSSLYPTYLSSGFGEAVAANRNAAKVFVTNIGADYETPSYSASDYLMGAYKYICLGDGRSFPMNQLFTTVLINTDRRKSVESYVEFDQGAFCDLPTTVLAEPFESEDAPGKHDGRKVVNAVFSTYEKFR